MRDDRLWDRTRTLAVGTITLTEGLPESRATDVMGGRLLRCATSAGANYRATRRARSRADFIEKMGIVEDESDEAIYWMELLSEAGLVEREELAPMMDNAREIVAMSVASIKTAKRNLKGEGG